MRVLALLLAGVALAAGGAVWWLRSDSPPPSANIAVAEALGGETTAGYARATAPRTFVFPRDHGPHPAYRTEWWYYTGNVATPEGRHFGYQLTFFRIALTPEAVVRASRWGATHVYMAHFAVTDTRAGRFRPSQRFARGAAGLAGAQASPFRVWLEDWSVEGAGENGLPMRLRAADGGAAIDLTLDAGKPVVLQGDHGLSRKGAEDGNASYYYSFTRMPTRGTIEIDGRRFAVAGASWMDREWSTSGLGDNVGWDWFALQLGDGRDLMFYRLRRADGSADEWSGGTLVAADGSARPLGSRDVGIDVLDTWVSPAGTRYPARWRLRLDGARLQLDLTPRLSDQELGEPLRYWEGAVRVEGTDGAVPVTGDGYVELVGYATSSRAPRTGAPGPR
ncbi:MAG TPA: lipocalin-like domain-containing protein [Methylomirabilota bacterium]|jgi:predicted secreted hydrolase